MRAILMAGIVCALTGAAQDRVKPASAKPELTAEQIIEKSIEASGGRKALEKMTSLSTKAIIVNSAQVTTSETEYYAKAPGKFLAVVRIPSIGEYRRGFDGTAGWTQAPMQAVTDVTGEALEALKREAIFNPRLHWRELYTKTALKGKVKIGVRDAYAIEMTPADGQVETHYFDAETFQMIRQKGERESLQGPVEITMDFQDFRDIGNGVKWAFLIKQSMPQGDIVTKMTEVNLDPSLDDAMFSKPQPKPAEPAK